MLSSKTPFINLKCAACFLAVAFSAGAAEPEVDSSELPRIPPKTPEEALETFKIKPGFRIELAASEPLVEDPIAIAFDEENRMFAVEMRGYSERRDEEMGRVSLLVDEDNDGVFDKSTVYVDGLKWPTGVACWDGGIFVCATPDILYCTDTDGDGKADVKEVVFTGFGEGRDRLNVQALVNSLKWGPDHRIYGATASNGGLVRRPDQPKEEALNLRGSDFSFDPKRLDLRKESGTAQYGLTFDDYGQRYVCSNSRHILAVMYSWPWNVKASLPNPLVSIPVDGGSAEVYRTSEVEPWRVVRTRWRVQGRVRGPVEGGGRASGYFTSASGLVVYRGDALGPDFSGNVFVGDVGSNLVHRKIIDRSSKEVKLSAHRPDGEQKVEFLTSTDNWFRPVFCENGPDGALYIVDMYRETIEHPWSIPETIKAHLDLNSGRQMGRIWRVVPEKFQRPKLAELSDASMTELVQLLAHSNGWTRDTAARLLFQEGPNPTAAEEMKKLYATAKSDAARVRLLHSMEAAHGWALESVLADALKDPSPQVRRHAVGLKYRRSLLANADDLIQDEDPWVRFELALALTDDEVPSPTLLVGLLGRSLDDPWIVPTLVEAYRKRGQIPGVFKALWGLENRDLLISFLESLAAAAPADERASLAKSIAEDAELDVAVRLLEALLGGGKPTKEELESLTPLFDRARSAPDSRSKVWMLGIDPQTEPVDLWVMVDNAPPKVARVAMEALIKRGREAWEKRAFENWSTLPAEIRTLVLTQASDEAVISAVEEGQLQPQEVPIPQRVALRSHKNEALQKRAIAAFGEADTRSREEVAAQFRPALDLNGNAKAGETLFQERCAACHLPNQNGVIAGPALDSFRNQGPAMLLEKIIDPNREVAPQYLIWQAVTKSGETHLGILAEETADSVTLRMAGGAEVELKRDQIDRLTCLNQSLMVEGMETGLTVKQMADLLAFLTK